MNKIRFFLSLKLQFLLFSLLVFIPLLFISSYLFQQYTKVILLDELKSKLLTITTLSADNFQGEISEKLLLTKNINMNEYKKIKQEIVNLKQTNIFIKYCAILVKKDANSAFYLVDSSIKQYDFNKDGNISLNEGVNLLSDKENEIRIATENALKDGFSKPALSNVIFTDQYGSWIRAYVPIKNSTAKNSAVLMTEMYISSMSGEKAKFFKLFEKILIISFIIILIFLFISAQLFIFPLKKLKENFINIRKGNFEKKISLSWFYGEMGELAESINEMSDDLQKSFHKNQEDKVQLEEMQKIIEITNQQIKLKNFQLNSTIVTLNSINELVEELISIKETKELMETVLPSTIELINAEKGFIVEYIPEQNCFKVMTSFNTTIIQKDMEILAKDNSCLKKIFDTRNYINIAEIGQIKDEEYKNALVFPFLVEKEIKGIMFIMNKKDGKEENYFAETDEATVRTVSKLVAAVWESIHLFELATVDNLSKLYVRRYFEMNLGEEIKKAIRNNNELSLIMIDIDNLQKCNANYGHFVGDYVIKEISDQIKECIGEEDLAARYGGEKLVVLVTDKSPDDAISIAEQIREAVETLEISVPIGENLKVTVSIGVSGFPDHGSTTEELIRSAEEAMYKAKKEGKNKVNLADNK